MGKEKMEKKSKKAKGERAKKKLAAASGVRQKKAVFSFGQDGPITKSKVANLFSAAVSHCLPTHLMSLVCAVCVGWTLCSADLCCGATGWNGKQDPAKVCTILSP
jgi:hypothetical protein